MRRRCVATDLPTVSRVTSSAGSRSRAIRARQMLQPRSRAWVCPRCSASIRYYGFVNEITKPTASARTRATAATAVGWLSVIGAVGSALLSLGHAGIDVPVLSALGPGGDSSVVQAAAAFAVGAVLYGIIAVGAFRTRPWAWFVGLTVYGLGVVGGVMQFRGVASAFGIAISLAALAVLLSSAGRQALRDR